MKIKKVILIVFLLLTILLVGCTAKDTVSQNISRDSDEFRVVRRVVFYNSITDTYMMEMTGNIAIDIDRDGVIEVIAKIGPDEYQKHYLGLSDNVTYTVEQIGTVDASEYRYKMIFKPESILPIDFDHKSGEEPMNIVDEVLKE
ncbi:hypothetical protein ACS127_10280 [Amphibacillus sp. Q70]|uniref:beta-sandwich lipoprotein n=1 Tax=Amphibacillus sp. Q70 TaxID=3453416 RepID=UPI003F8295DF